MNIAVGDIRQRRNRSQFVPTVKAFLDTSVLVATFYGDHEHHERSFELFVALNKRTGFIAAHSLAETYFAMTGMPGKHRVSPDEALLFLDDVRERLSVVALDADAYDAAIKAAASYSIMGGAVMTPYSRTPHLTRKQTRFTPGT